MAYGKNIDWRGCPDSTPSADPKHSPTDMPEPKNTGVDWHGMEDSTPSATPKPPDKQP